MREGETFYFISFHFILTLCFPGGYFGGAETNAKRWKEIRRGFTEWKTHWLNKQDQSRQRIKREALSYFSPSCVSPSVCVGEDWGGGRPQPMQRIKPTSERRRRRTCRRQRGETQPRRFAAVTTGGYSRSRLWLSVDFLFLSPDALQRRHRNSRCRAH